MTTRPDTSGAPAGLPPHTLPGRTDSLDGLLLADLLRAGIYRLFKRTDHLNKINVFPVPDGDTGTNMAMTLAAVLSALDREPVADAGRVLTRAADAALDGARGNSGAILAQFLMGLGDGAGQRARLGLTDFAAAVQSGATYARDALMQPQEGTILTVLREFADALQKSLADSSAAADFGTLFERSLVRVRTALEQTRGQLKELRSADVVDAGAQGFVDMLEGMLRFLQTGDKGESVAPVHEGDEAMAGSMPVAAGQDFRFCTECLVVARAESVIELRGLRESLSTVGASLVVSGSKHKARIHIHCDDPDAIFRTASMFGEVQSQKADDMRMQQSAVHHRRAQRVAVVTDSGSDLPDAEMERLGIHMVAARVHFGGRSYLDKVSMTSAEFYDELAVNPEHPKTSQPPPGDFRRIFEFLVSHYESVISVNLTARHSGTYNAAVTVAQRVSAEGRRVAVVDTRNASVGEALVVLAAAEAAAEGQDLDQVVAATESARDRTQTFALVERIDFAVRGGRVPAAVGNIARWLRLNVILRTFPDGRVAFGGGLFGSHRLIDRFIRLVRRRSDIDSGTHRIRLLVGHANRPEAGQRLYDELRAAIPPQRIAWSALTDMGAAIGVHGGPGTLIVAVQRLED